MADRKITLKLDEKNLLDIIEDLKIAKTKRKFWLLRIKIYKIFH